MRFILVILATFFVQLCTGQQDNQYTQFADTKLFYNPGYAGFEDRLAITGRIRNQWSGLTGAPQGQTLLVDFPSVYKSLGFGLNLSRATIGIQEKNDISGSYAYRLKLAKASVGMGLQLSYRQFINDFTKEGLIAIDGFDKDPSIEKVSFSQGAFNVGLGVFLGTEKYYLGLSVPRLAKTDIDATGDNNLTQEVRHLYGMFGLNLTLNSDWKVLPSLLLKVAENSPFDLDLQSSFVYRDQLHLGINFRTGGTQSTLLESTSVIIGFDFTKNIFASMSYDFNTTPLRQYEDGSFELILKYTLHKDSTPDSIQNPRYY